MRCLDFITIVWWEATCVSCAGKGVYYISGRVGVSSTLCCSLVRRSSGMGGSGLPY